MSENKEEDIIIEGSSSAEIITRIHCEISLLINWVFQCTSLSYQTYETQLIPKIFIIGKLFVLLFLAMREERYVATHTEVNIDYKNQGPKSRIFGSFFGKLRYWRSYLFHQKESGGYYPLDAELGLTKDGFSILVQSYAMRLATKVSYAQTVGLLTLFLGWSPAQRTIEETVLGFGRYTSEWFES